MTGYSTSQSIEIAALDAKKSVTEKGSSRV